MLMLNGRPMTLETEQYLQMVLEATRRQMEAMQEAAKKNNIKTASWLTDSFSEEELTEIKLLGRLSAVIQRQRRALDMTQDQLATKLDVSQGMVSRWENGEENMTIETIAKLAVALDLSVQSPIVTKNQLKKVIEIIHTYEQRSMYEQWTPHEDPYHKRKYFGGSYAG